MGELTKRERWLIIQAFRQGYGQGHNDTVEGCYNSACEHEDDGAVDWLNDCAADAVTVADVLAKDAPQGRIAELEPQLEHAEGCGRLLPSSSNSNRKGDCDCGFEK